MNNRNEFIFKLEMMVDLPTEECFLRYDDFEKIYDADGIMEKYFAKLMNQVLILFVWLKYCFNKCMLCFKIKFEQKPDDDDEDYFILVQSMENLFNTIVDEQASMKSDDARIVDSRVLQEGNEMIFAVVWKNFVQTAPNLSCTASHCQPKFDYYCDTCQSKPWLQW